MVQDRQADAHGQCAMPYEDNCANADPEDDTDVCYVDMSNSPHSSHVKGGISVFPGDSEGPTYCAGFAWAEDEGHYTNRYKANSLFYVSMFDAFYKRGYVKNVPGAPMCGCLEQMPVVSRADCVELHVTESVKWEIAIVGQESNYYA